MACLRDMDAKKPYIAAILVQLGYAGFYALSKAAFDTGMSTFVFIFYRQLAASMLLVPLAFVFERKNYPPLTFMILLKLFCLALFGLTWSLNFYSLGLKYTSASMGSAATNSIPVFTFLFAIFLRMENIKFRSVSGISKVLGIAFCLAGVMTIALYRGTHIRTLNLHHSSGQNTKYQNNVFTPKRCWIEGSIFLIVANMIWSMWLVLQGIMLKEYPSKLIFTTLQCLFSTFQSGFVALVFERDSSKWTLQLDLGLLAILYCGFVVTGLNIYLQSFCIEKKGPVFTAMFTPLALVFTLICSTVFLGEMIYLGSLLGGILMVLGLYSVLWGKAKEGVSSEVSIEDGKTRTEEKEATGNHSDAVPQ
ncbi:WAT1-related protein At5g64700-like [Zingiber officinale]|uniref:WAT1-related protein At5g64700-like n=1 Tax=Zingiber officinale TaxID=94328 RepID=UPI001C4B7313|nr:WAT1-related protein At5g64700-like [Zingiber officinale]